MLHASKAEPITERHKLLLEVFQSLKRGEAISGGVVTILSTTLSNLMERDLLFLIRKSPDVGSVILMEEAANGSNYYTQKINRQANLIKGAKEVNSLEELGTLGPSVKTALLRDRLFSRHTSTIRTKVPIQGFVKETAEVATTVTLGPKVIVYGDAKISDAVQVLGESKIGGESILADYAVLKDVKIAGRVEVAGYTQLSNVNLMEGRIITNRKFTNQKQVDNWLDVMEKLAKKDKTGEISLHQLIRDSERYQQ